MNKLIKSILWLGLSMLLSNCATEQNNCETLIQETLIIAKKEIDEKGLSAQAAESYILQKNEELKTKHPGCFPITLTETTNVPQKSKVKLDSENLNDKQIKEINQQYQLAEDTCKETLRNEIQNYTQEEINALLHECIMEKIVNYYSETI